MILDAAALGAIAAAGENVLTLIEGLEEHEFERSRVTRHAVRRQLQSITTALEIIDADAQAAMPEIDWAGWATMGEALCAPGSGADSAAWFTARALVPATLMWLQIYRREQPRLFALSP